MRQIVNGKMYNTETAILIGSYGIDTPNDPTYSMVELYMKKTGEFFVYTESNRQDNRVWAYDHQDKVRADWSIIPITEGTAKQIAEHFKVDTYIGLFGAPSE